MVKKATKADLKNFTRAGMTITPKSKPKVLDETPVKVINTELSSPEMKLAIQRAMETSIALAKNTQELLTKTAEDNRILMTKMVEIVDSKNSVVRLDVNRNNKDMMTSVDVIRGK